MLSSTKQIVQIRQIIALMCERHGSAIPAHGNESPVFAFPTTAQIASLSETELRPCKMGFRAPNLLATAKQIAEGKFDLERIRQLPHAEARAELMKLRGEVGRLRHQQNNLQETAQSETNRLPDMQIIQIHAKARFISLPLEDLQALGVQWMSEA